MLFCCIFSIGCPEVAVACALPVMLGTTDLLSEVILAKNTQPHILSTFLFAYLTTLSHVFRKHHLFSLPVAVLNNHLGCLILCTKNIPSSFSSDCVTLMATCLHEVATRPVVVKTLPLFLRLINISVKSFSQSPESAKNLAVISRICEDVCTNKSAVKKHSVYTISGLLAVMDSISSKKSKAKSDKTINELKNCLWPFMSTLSDFELQHLHVALCNSSKIHLKILHDEYTRTQKFTGET
eukprot:TRINITY_DN3419_c0_g1_i2.p1 TRINITY_DN3419_c0_g1~~TRINITY_DN3419_c0_g1_i2.p1  ORF type:complete len:239 (+),score=41.72 TRINITY_DN3419_c0_g1_i2:38-754(+)